MEVKIQQNKNNSSFSSGYMNENIMLLGSLVYSSKDFGGNYLTRLMVLNVQSKRNLSGHITFICNDIKQNNENKPIYSNISIIYFHDSIV